MTKPNIEDETVDCEAPQPKLTRQALLDACREIDPARPTSQKLKNGTKIFLLKPTGKTFRTWQSMLRDESGAPDQVKWAVNEELWLTLVLVDENGSALFTAEDVVEEHVFDYFALPILKEIKDIADRMAGRPVFGDDTGKN